MAPRQSTRDMDEHIAMIPKVPMARLKLFFLMLAPNGFCAATGGIPLKDILGGEAGRPTIFFPSLVTKELP